MSASFSLREELEGGNFTWTSNGPTPHGDIGEVLHYFYTIVLIVCLICSKTFSCAHVSFQVHLNKESK